MRHILSQPLGIPLFVVITLALSGSSPALALTCPPNTSAVQSLTGSFEGYDTNVAQESFGTPPDPRAFHMLSADIPDWDTTANDDLVEIWETGFIGIFSVDGDYHAELSATEPSILFRDIIAAEDDIILWSAWHRGRDGTDTAHVIIDDPALNANVEQVMTTGNANWQNYSGSYVVPPDQPQTRLSLVSVASASPYSSIGNFVDLVEIAVCRSNPPARIDVVKSSSVFF